MNFNPPNIVDEKGHLHSIYPCEGYLTFGPWIYLVPQYKPKSVLMLGYGGGTAAGLIRKFYGDVPITAVDIEDQSQFNYYDVNLVTSDARDYIRDCKSFDCVIVDIYKSGELRPESFVFSKEFAQNIKQLANYIIIYATELDDLSSYSDLYLVRVLTLPFKGSIPDGKFYYYMVKDIPILPVR